MNVIRRVRDWWADQVKEEAAWTDKAIVLLTFAIVLVGVVQTVIFTRQWQEMHSGGVDTHDLAAAAKSQADEAKVQAEQAKIQAEKATESAAYMKQLSQDTLAEADATKRLGIETKKSAEYAAELAKTAAAELRTAEATAHNDQRAWIGEQQATLDTYEVGKPISVTINLANTGKSPARHISYTSVVSVLPRWESPSFGLEVPNPSWTGIASIPPQGGYQLRVTTATVLSQAIKDLIESSDRVIWVWGSLHYEDIFDAGHVTQFCAFSLDQTSSRRAANQGMIMHSCPAGNHHDEMD